MATHYAEVDLIRLVRRAAGHFDGLAAERGIALVVEAPECVAGRTRPREARADVPESPLERLQVRPEWRDGSLRRPGPRGAGRRGPPRQRPRAAARAAPGHPRNAPQVHVTSPRGPSRPPPG